MKRAISNPRSVKALMLQLLRFGTPVPLLWRFSFSLPSRSAALAENVSFLNETKFRTCQCHLHPEFVLLYLIPRV